MESSVLKDYEELCRLCASYDAIKLPIFSDKGKERKLKDKITTCLPFDVSEDDLLPKSLCYRCIYNLENFYDFRRGCIDARTKLESVIKNALKTKENVNIKEEYFCSNQEEQQQAAAQLEEDVVESDGETDCPNPADFLEACLVTARDPPNSNGPTSPKILDYLGLKRSEEYGFPPPSLPPPSRPSSHHKGEGSSPHGSRNGEEDDGQFSCKICSRQFSTKSSLTIHLKFHQDLSGGVQEGENGGYSCFICEKVFSSKGHLALHSKVHIGETNSPSASAKSSPSRVAKIYRCDLCCKTYSGAKHLWAHVSATHKGHPALTCLLCQKTFSSVSNLEDHLRSKHRDQASLTNQVQITRVVGDEDSNSKPHEESSADASLNRRKSSKPRKIERDGNNPDTDVLFKNMISSFSSREVVKEENPVFSCMFCPELLSEGSDLSRHLLECHGYDGPLDFSNAGHQATDRSDYESEVLAESMMESETVFCCEVCVREFSDRGSLWLHILYTHKAAASKACGICLKICEDTESLLKHVESAHPKGLGEGKSDQRRYSCQVCARQHDSRKKLVTHAKIHKLVDTEGNPVDPETVVIQNPDFYADGFIPTVSQPSGATCELCFKVFENDSRLIKHKKMVHRGPYQGNNCGTVTSGPFNFYFACEICGLSHLTRSERWKHMSTVHAGETSVTCEVPECGKVFPTSALKTEHANHHAAQGQYPNTCEVCGKMWKTRVEYWKHMMGVHPDYLPFICGVCLKVFCNLSDLIGHVRNTHWPLLGGDFCCDICGRPYSKVSKMSRHRKVHYVPGNPPEIQTLLDHPKVQSEPHFLQQTSKLVCEMCENSTYEFENIDLLGKHRQEAHNVLPCDLCAKYYGRTSHLWKHVNKIHKGHPDVTCPTCQRTSASRAHLASHIAKHHRPVEAAPVTPREPKKEDNGVHTCEKCSKIFRKESLVKKHIKHCKGPRPPPLPLPPPVNGIYQCDRCTKSFAHRNLLYKHFKHTHAYLDCELCDVKVNTRTELYVHVCSAHADDPSVKCDKCDMILRCKADLIKHSKGHHLSCQLHCCKFCGELVTSKYKLRRHLKARHSNESKFLCALCLQALTNIEELIAHVEENHKANLVRKFTCHICGKPGSSKSKLFEHLKYHGTKYVACTICFKIFSSKEELDEHVNNHPTDSTEEEEEEMELELSSVKNESEEEPEEIVEPVVKQDKRKAISDGQETDAKKSKSEFQCAECSGIFYSKMKLRKHIKSKHLNPLFIDEESEFDSRVTDLEESGFEGFENTLDSDQSFLNQSPTKRETKSKPTRKVYEDSESPIDCGLCGKTWPAKKHLWQHLVRYHKNECGSICGVCLKMCPDYPSLSAHLVIEHPNNFDNDSSVLVCRVCGKYHNARTKLLNHASIHIGHEDRVTDPRHHCLICSEAFHEYSYFSNHILNVHNITSVETVDKLSHLSNNQDKENDSGKLPFHTCDVCSLVFASEIGLANHKRIHENSDNFKCGQCGEVFQSAENLCTHKLQKHKGTEFVCADCKSNFSTYNALIEHNKLCKMKIKNMDDNSDDDEEFILDDDIEELENSYDVNDTIMSSGSDDIENDDLEKSEFPDESSGTTSDDEEKSNLTEIDTKELSQSTLLPSNAESLSDEIQNS